MWEKVSVSSILFNRNFYDSNNFYLNSVFIKKVYFYYTTGGYYNIITTQITNILVSNFIIWFILFLINVIDYQKIIGLNETIYYNELFKWGNFFNLNYFMWIMVVIFLIYTLIKILNLFDNIIKYYHIKKFFNKTININDEHLNFIEWETIIDKISSSQSQKLDICLINSIITTKDNYIVALFDEGIISIEHLTNLMEWNIIYCILMKLLQHFNKNCLNDKEYYQDKNLIVNEIQILTKTISIINFIFMPFILTIMLFYTIFSYGEQFYNNPMLLGSRIFTRIAKLKFKYYNELNDEHNRRLASIEKLSTCYTKLFSNNIYNEIAKLIVFILSSFFIVIVFLSVLNDKILLNVLITKNQSLLWIIGIIGSIIAIFKVGEKKNENPQKIMDKITDKVFIEKDFSKFSYKNENYNKFCDLYQFKIVYLVKEIIYTILTPFHLWIISYNIETIASHIIDITKSHDEIFFINKYSDFSTLFDSNIGNTENRENRDENKLQLSFKIFREKYPEWEKKRFKKIYNMEESVQINII
jgi:autophagy-related protein 9